jgi:NTP pyrophosphatase (non-canonical NTP hydrolase)
MTFDEYGQFTVDLWVSGERTIKDVFAAKAYEKSENVDMYKRIKLVAAENESERNLSIMALGLAGETGEVIEKIKKILRDGTYDEENIVKELGDVVYYWARLCRFFGKNPSEIIAANVEKLESRKARGVLRGSGDNR